MSLCKYAKDYNSYCSTCGCDATPGYERECGDIICLCECNPEKNILIAIENEKIFQITDFCRAHFSLRMDHTEWHKYLILKGQFKKNQNILIDYKIIFSLKKCDNCSPHIKKIKFVNYPND
ncbi:hypothetical protein [Spiroplasma endosymbiont of Aspidapion aeneum]|uniref:hypothetical protein n=1 Tax=Spiroplasma endosymbiont of Aspidapion aeneum TaxID=3066276 RepID=UPI00313DA6E0